LGAGLFVSNCVAWSNGAAKTLGPNLPGHLRFLAVVRRFSVWPE
jgi:hypothetical protein